MKIGINHIRAVALLGIAALAFLYYANKNKFEIGELLAPVIINMEIEKPYADNYRIAAEPDNRIFYLWPTGSAQNDLKNTVVHTEINGEFIQKLFLQYSGGQNASAPIDNISVFIGNKTFYYSKNVIEKWEWKEMEGGVLFQLPVKPYAHSAIKPWINWYGDLNFALKEITAFLINPVSFSVVFICVLFCISLLLKEIKTIDSIVKNNNKIFEIGIMLLLLIFAFLLRINGLTRHSSWGDELYSMSAANPQSPLLKAFNDPGNPPLFYLLLRLWYTIFGWSEASGRMLCVVIGIAGIVSLYSFVKMKCGRRYAFLSAFLLALQATHIGFSNEIRAYILQMALAPLAAQLLFCVLQKDSAGNYVRYVLAGAAIVNTHYYGALLIAFNFIYYIINNRKQLFSKKTIYFFIANAVIALSLLPFFVIAAFQRALRNSSFNSWIPRLDKESFIVFAVVLFICLLIPLIKRLSKTVKKISAQYGGFFEYTIYACSFIFIMAFIISLKRPIFTWRYLSICLPFLISIISFAVVNTLRYGKLDALIRLIFFVFLIRFSCGFRMFGGGFSDVFKEAQEYINADAQVHSLKFAELGDYGYDPSYYNLEKIPSFSKDENYEVVYLNPLHKNEDQMARLLTDSGLDGENILRIKTNYGKYILKKYLIRKSGG
jgi:hypothetical protein